MCGRFALFSPLKRLANRVGASTPENMLKPRYNVAPGTWIAAIHQPSEEAPPIVEEMWWGYRPKWAKGSGNQPINARVETVATNAYFRSAFAKHRCLIPADGWYEWIKNSKPKQPHFICRKDREPLFFAGIFSERDDGSLSCAIVTEPGRGSAAEVHDRMPLILDDDSLEHWLAPDITDRETIKQMVQHIDADLIEHWPVSTAVNKPAEGQGDELINPA
ncbi:SOS response-associated peptidase [Vreelandella populi]|uniref:Abasic site processing protein n=1 Tax=Vreelandella populi TaxID=2498858 RepID=A0A433L9S3_9GAMM|nr:SOS response-associated peptidase [Halomonas populi]RUR41414.1 SOS response-associated peptidase [Halomonas populi]RUR44391.1 SOS response-associated peptidase [Halomonas populi]